MFPFFHGNFPGVPISMEIFPENSKFSKIHGKFSKNGKFYHFDGKFNKNVFFTWEIFTHCNITVASMIKIPMHLRNFFPML
jgi:hypothetical protein